MLFLTKALLKDLLMSSTDPSLKPPLNVMNVENSSRRTQDCKPINHQLIKLGNHGEILSRMRVAHFVDKYLLISVEHNYMYKEFADTNSLML